MISKVLIKVMIKLCWKLFKIPILRRRVKFETVAVCFFVLIASHLSVEMQYAVLVVLWVRVDCFTL